MWPADRYIYIYTHTDMLIIRVHLCDQTKQVVRTAGDQKVADIVVSVCAKYDIPETDRRLFGLFFVCESYELYLAPSSAMPRFLQTASLKERGLLSGDSGALTLRVLCDETAMEDALSSSADATLHFAYTDALQSAWRREVILTLDHQWQEELSGMRLFLEFGPAKPDIAALARTCTWMGALSQAVSMEKILAQYKLLSTPELASKGVVAKTKAKVARVLLGACGGFVAARCSAAAPRAALLSPSLLEYDVQTRSSRCYQWGIDKARRWKRSFSMDMQFVRVPFHFQTYAFTFVHNYNDTMDGWSLIWRRASDEAQRRFSMAAKSQLSSPGTAPPEDIPSGSSSSSSSSSETPAEPLTQKTASAPVEDEFGLKIGEYAGAILAKELGAIELQSPTDMFLHARTCFRHIDTSVPKQLYLRCRTEEECFFFLAIVEAVFGGLYLSSRPPGAASREAAGVLVTAPGLLPREDDVSLMVKQVGGLKVTLEAAHGETGSSGTAADAVPEDETPNTSNSASNFSTDAQSR